MSWFIGVDVGGTFTDLYAQDQSSGAVVLHKTLSTPRNPAEAILRGLADLNDLHGIPLDQVTHLAHGTTVATNALIQRRGVEVTLLTTEGFRDLLEIGRQIRPKMFDLKEDSPAPLSPRSKRWEVAERITVNGTVVKALEQGTIDALLDRLADEKPAAVAICLLFSFLNPAHEQALASAIRARFPDIALSVSSEVQPEFREYERASTTVLNSYLLPVMSRYVDTLKEGLAATIPNAKVGINQSSGGLMSPDTTRAFPIRTGMSGPAAGIVGAIHMGRLSQRPNMITLDMGGTSADVCLIQDYAAGQTYAGDIAGFPIRLPMVDVHTVGAGGGSIAWFDRDGLLKVGPYSAGADPGPACYGSGGTDPTVSDANVILGRLPGSGLLGGSMPLDRDAAERVLKPLADRLGYSLQRTAAGIVSIVVANMVAAIRVISVEKGYDPRDFTLVAMGGAGALHTTEVARELGIHEVLVPAAPGILCAQGLVVADQREEFVASGRTPLTTEAQEDLAGQLQRLAVTGTDWYVQEAISPDRQRAAITLDMRYVGQNFEIPVKVPVAPDAIVLPDTDTLRQAFFEAHEKLYGFHNPDDAVEVINLRLAVSGKARGGSTEVDAATATTPPDPVQTIQVCFDGETYIPTALYDRALLRPGQAFTGPAIIAQMDATTVVFPGDRVRVDGAGNLLMEIL